MRIALMALALVTIVSCMSAERVQARENQLIEEWKADNPDEVLTPEKEQELKIEALRQVKEEVAAEQKEAGKIGGKVAGAALSGDWISAALGLIQLGILGAGSHKKSKGEA